MRVVALVGAFAIAVASCGSLATEPRVGPDHTVEELGEILRQLGVCEKPTIEQSGNPAFPTVRSVACSSEDVPGGLSATSFPTSQQRLLWVMGTSAFGCEAEDNLIITYVFGDKWVIAPGYTLEESEMTRIDQLIQDIADQTGGVANTISCQDVFDRFDIEVWDAANDDEKAELVRTAFREPG